MTHITDVDGYVAIRDGGIPIERTVHDVTTVLERDTDDSLVLRVNTDDGDTGVVVDLAFPHASVDQFNDAFINEIGDGATES